MQQINIRVKKEVDDLITYLAKKRRIPKAVYAKQIMLDNLTEKTLPGLLNDYKEGKIGLKRILKLTSITPDELLDKIVELQIEPAITSEIDDYTADIVKKYT